MAQQEKTGLKRGVTLYSYQEEFYTRAMTLEDCLAEVASMGADGVELLPEQMVPDYPNPSQSWVDQWFNWLDKYHLKPVCLDTFVDNTWGGHRVMSLDESVETLVMQMKMCNRLGFKMMRPTTGHDAAPEMMLKAIPYAEKYEVKIAFELHTPVTLGSKFIDNYLGLIEKTGTRHFGFTLDLGLFCTRVPRIVSDYHLRHGASEEVVRYAIEAFANRADAQTVDAEVKKMSTKEIDHMMAMFAYRYGPATNDPRDLPYIIPHIFNIHGKFYEMTEEMREYSVPYETILPILMEHGCAAYINSEYEGQRWTQNVYDTDSCEILRRHHLMLKQLLGEN